MQLPSMVSRTGNNLSLSSLYRLFRRLFIHPVGQIFLSKAIPLHELMNPDNNICMLAHKDPYFFRCF
jgi:hypothetical protein